MAWRNTECTQLAALSSSASMNALLQHVYGLADDIHDVATRTVRQHMATTSCKIAVQWALSFRGLCAQYCVLALS